MAALSAGARAVLEARSNDPFGYLGMQKSGSNLCVRVFLPWARRLSVTDAATGEVAGELARIHPDGLWSGMLGPRPRFQYRLRAEGALGASEFPDIYSFAPVLGDLDIHLLAEGTHHESYNVLGAHCREHDGVAGVSFAVWAPNAQRVSVVGDFNDWDGRRCLMRLRHAAGVWEIFIPGLAPGRIYKYEIVGENGALLPLKADPYAQRAERPPRTGSCITAPPAHRWEDQAWIAERWQRNDRHAPVAIYEAHLGSWRRKPEEGERYLTYRELADEIVPYVREMGFTHLELMPVGEYPFDGSWGYQTLGMYAPSARFGPPEGFARFVQACHAKGIGVILDWVPAHFPVDAHGLARFDGTALYEYEDPREGFHRDWNTYIYNFGRPEVRNFLAGSALYWIDRYGVDGLRVDAVASMIYRDYSRTSGEWLPNRYGGRENLEAISLLKHINEVLGTEAPGAVTMAEESTTFPNVTEPTYAGGLGFHFKWNMGWMHDTLQYMRQPHVQRRWHHEKLTFGLVYAFSENFLLPLSHDEVVHGKGSLIGKMPGDDWQRFANLRAYYGFMWAHPGKKLLFMGQEFAQDSEWNHDAELPWHLLNNARNAGVRQLVRDLNRVYRELPAMHRQDCDGFGFDWLESTEATHSLLAWVRRDADGHMMIAVSNMTPVPQFGWRLGVPDGPTGWREVLNTDSSHYGGGNVGNASAVLPVTPVASHGRAQSIMLVVPPLATIYLVPG